MKKQKSAFTLVELIVVITILAILGTIAFISLQGYSKKARDSKRTADIANIKVSLELFSLNTGYYPLPDNGEEVLYDNDLLWTQGIVGDNVTTNLGRNLLKKPTDPLHEIEYIYSLASSKKEYEVMSVYEGDLATNSLINSTYASDKYSVKVEGNYNELFVKTSNHIFPVPSLITSASLPLDFDLVPSAIESQVITGGDNFPGLNIPNTKTQTGALKITLSVYTGSIDKNSEDDVKKAVVEKIQLAYSGSDIETTGVYKTLLEKTTDDELLAFVNDVVLNKTSSNKTNYSCIGDMVLENADVLNIDGLTSNIEWQDTDSEGFCYYQCKDSYIGNNCTNIKGEKIYDTPGTFSWTVPDGLTSVSIVCVGGGASGENAHDGAGGGGGALGYKNNITVTPGSTYSVVIGAGGNPSATKNGGNSSITINGNTLLAQGGTMQSSTIGTTTAATYSGADGGGNGGGGDHRSGVRVGGSGAGGYSGAGGVGGRYYGSSDNLAQAGSGGGGGGGYGSSVSENSQRQCSGGGGTGLYGVGSNGTAGNQLKAGGGGSNGVAGKRHYETSDTVNLPNGGFPGGGGGGGYSGHSATPTYGAGYGGGGACRIIWPGDTRQFPNTDVNITEVPDCLNATIRDNNTQSILDLSIGTWACMISNDGWVYALKLKEQIPRTTGTTNVTGGDSWNYIDKVYTKNPSGVWRETTSLDDDHTIRHPLNGWNIYTDSNWYGDGAYWLFSDGNCDSIISRYLDYSYQIWSGNNCSDGTTTLFRANSEKHYINELRY